MRGIRRLAVCTAVIGLLTAGAVGASMEIAHADGTVARCFGAGDTTVPYECVLKSSVADPATITVAVTDPTPGDNVTVNWTVQCTDNDHGTLGTAGAPAATPLPVSLDLTLPTNAADSTCAVSATVNLAPPYTTKAYTPCVNPTATATPTATPTSTASPSPVCPSEFTATLSFTSAAAASPSPAAPVHPVKGYAGKCLDDKGNSSANRAQVVIWSCGSSDPAENWKFSNHELVHNGMCLNDQGNGGNRTKVILWTCNGAANEKWTHLANGEFRLQAHNNAYCLDDPGYSTTNGTQLIIYSCKVSANQKWSLP